MYENHISAMAQSLIAAGLISEDNREAAKKVLTEYWRDSFAYVWTIGDIQTEHNLTDDQARQVLEAVVVNLHAAFGINWAVLDQWAVELFGPECRKPQDEINYCPWDDYEEQEDDQ